MKKSGLLLLTLLGLTSLSYAQQNWCGTDARLTQKFADDPQAAEQFVQHYLNQSHQDLHQGDRSPVIIPVVVHVIHDNGTGNISVEQIQSGIDMLNADYNRLNADTADTRNTANAPFKPLAVSFDISFALAKIDPDGNCTNGIERRNSPGATYNAGENAKYYAQGGLDAWPRDQYMNIWIVNSIESDGGAGVTLGYAEFPQFATDGYGVIIRHDSYGTVGTASGDRTLTHEIGHCLGLLHTFQGPFFGTGTGCHTSSCDGAGDFVCDTPPASEAHWSCPSTYNSCTSVPTNDEYGFDAYDQWENYMSYAPCQNMFSQGQLDNVTSNLTDIAFLEDLVSLANQTATGVLLPEVLCQASFYSNTQIICQGGSVDFFDESFFNVTGWNWTFEGATTGSSTDQNPVVTYANAGTFDVTLEATDGVSTVSITLADYILVLPNPGDVIPYKEGFETLPAVPDNDRFSVQNDNGGSTWELTSSTAYSGYDCAYLENFGVTDGSKDALISGTIDLSSLDANDTLIFFFRYAYKSKTDADDEWLKFLISKDCGETWSVRKNLHANGLSDEFTSASYIPADKTEWQEVNITNITSDYFVSDFRYKFEFTNDGGNNIYLDHINMYPVSMIGINENEAPATVQVFPNPATNQVQVKAYFSEPVDCIVSIENSVGQVVAEIYNGFVSEGQTQWSYDLSGLASGVYFIRLNSEQGSQVIKLIKE